MKIDRIVKIKKNTNILYSMGERIAVLKDYELSKFGISEDKELSNELYDKINNDIQYPRAYEKAVDRLAATDKTVYEIQKKLEAYGFSQMIIDRAVAELKRRHFIDDKRYAQNFILSKSNTKSINEICYILKTKGISKELIDEITEEDEYSDDKAVRTIIIKKMKNKDLTDKNELRKLTAYVCNKGFEYELVKRTITQIMEEQEAD